MFSQWNQAGVALAEGARRERGKMSETNEERMARLCGAVERALVERREVKPERARMYVERDVLSKAPGMEREMGLMYLAQSFDLFDVIAE